MESNRMSTGGVDLENQMRERVKQLNEIIPLLRGVISETKIKGSPLEDISRALAELEKEKEECLEQLGHYAS